jgi:prephenate dehydratase
MERIVFGIQGGKGSFNEQAILTFVDKKGIKNYKVKYLYTTERVLKELDQGKINYGVFAIHNSVGGIVHESINAMGKYNFKIAGEIKIIISHYLMKRKDVKLSEIDTIMTHPQVLAQCRSTLAEKYSHLKKTSGKGDLIDHAMVAKEMSEKKLPRNIAVMGSKILADIYDLDIIEGDLQDNKRNWTYFLLVDV